MVPNSVHYSRQNSSGGCLAVRLTKAHSGWPNTHPLYSCDTLSTRIVHKWTARFTHTIWILALWASHFRVMLHTHLFLCVDLYTPDKSKQQDSLNLILHTNFIFFKYFISNHEHCLHSAMMRALSALFEMALQQTLPLWLCFLLTAFCVSDTRSSSMHRCK